MRVKTARFEKSSRDKNITKLEQSKQAFEDREEARIENELERNYERTHMKQEDRDEQIIEARKRAIEQLKARQSDLLQEIAVGISTKKPVGIMSDLGIAMHVEPKKGVLIPVNGVNYVWSKDSAPSAAEVKKWEDLRKRAEEIGHDELYYTGAPELRENGTIGNYRVVERAEMLEKDGLLTSLERKNLELLRQFYKDHPDLKDGKSTNWGVFENGKIVLSTPESREKKWSATSERIQNRKQENGRLPKDEDVLTTARIYIGGKPTDRVAILGESGKDSYDVLYLTGKRAGFSETLFAPIENQILHLYQDSNRMTFAEAKRQAKRNRLADVESGRI